MRKPRGEYSRRAAKSDWRGRVAGAVFRPTQLLRHTGRKLHSRVRKPAGRAPLAGSLGRNHRDFDQQSRVGELGLDARPAWQVLALGPGVPGLIHGVAQANVGDPNGGRYNLRLVGAAQLEEAIDLFENLLGLALGVLLWIGSGDASGEHEAVGLDDLGIDFRWLVTRDGHCGTPLQHVIAL